MEKILSIEVWWKQQDQAQAEIARLREALEQYADLDNWSFKAASLWPLCRLGPGPAQKAIMGEEE